MNRKSGKMKIFPRHSDEMKFPKNPKKTAKNIFTGFYMNKKHKIN